MLRVRERILMQWANRIMSVEIASRSSSWVCRLFCPNYIKTRTYFPLFTVLYREMHVLVIVHPHCPLCSSCLLLYNQANRAQESNGRFNFAQAHLVANGSAVTARG